MEFSRKWGDNVFIGEYLHTIDTKGRVIIPSKFRDELGSKFIVTKGLDNCLFVYPQGEWKNFENKLKQLPLTSRDARAFVRLFFSGAIECELDKQGRITISQTLREHAKMNKDVVIIGVSTRVEIWSKEEWDHYNETADLSYDDIAEKMAELGI